MNILKVLLTGTLGTVAAFASTQPLPATFQGSTTDYIAFDGNSFPQPNLICFSAGCGGAFQATISGPNVTSATVPGFLATVWCVDYQLDVTTASQYITNITTIGDINATTQSNVRYGTLDSSGTSSGWVNSVTDTSGIDSGDANSSAYRYTLAAALTSQYVDSGNTIDPTNPNGGSAVNTAIQEAIWYVTYNNEYPADGTVWPPASDIGSATCAAGQNVSNGGNTNYACWVKYAEDNAASVNTSAWGVVSGPTDASGVLQAPASANGYPSYQTFLVQMDGGSITHQGVTPEPTYLVLIFGLGGLMLFARIRKAAKQA